MERLGYQPRVRPEEVTRFGASIAPPDLLDGLPRKENGAAPFDIWRIAPAEEDPAAAASRPLVDGSALILTHPEIDPNAGLDITFSGAHPNYDAYALFGWTTGVSNQPFVWSEGRLGLICFVPKPIPPGAEVEVVFDCFPLLAKGIRDVQRVDVGMNDYNIGTLHLDQPVPESLPRLLIPAAVWNELPVGMITLRFRDLISPYQLHQNDDRRQMALGTRKITFRTVDVQVARP
jgi:hypothetical protein